jgi:hypothetical protein
VALTNRARAYEAATLFKIAARRINRLQSPRPNEITRMLSDVRACLDRTGS